MKQWLRSKLRADYSHHTVQECRDIDDALIERLVKTDVYIKSNRVFLFASSGDEVYTHSLIKNAYQSKEAVALPKCFGKGVMEFYRYNGELINGKYNIPEPTTDELLIPSEGDLMVVPGLAFDREGYRVGQGGGYYDRYLAKHHCITIGVCRSRYLIECAPREWNDLPVDYVITETELIISKNGASEEAPLC